MKQRKTTKIIIQLCLLLFFATVVIAPIVGMFLRITPESFREMTSSSQFMPALINSVTTTLTATVISVVLALCASFAVCRTDIRGKSFFAMLFTLPMLIPSISHAYGLKALFGVNGSGILSVIFGDSISIFGFWGIVAGSVMYSFPVAFLMLQSILQYEDGMPYKAAAVLGIPRIRRFTGITLPYLKKTLISTFFAVFTMIITDYGVPEALYNAEFGKTVSILMYENVLSVEYGRASVVGLLLLIPAVIAFAVDLLVPEQSQSGFVTEYAEPGEGRAARTAAYVFCILLSVIVAMPIVAFGVQMFASA